MERTWKIVVAGCLLVASLGACTHRLEITSPDKPIEIEVVVRVQQEIAVLAQAPASTAAEVPATTLRQSGAEPRRAEAM
jgi:hypothetical protein